MGKPHRKNKKPANRRVFSDAATVAVPIEVNKLEKVKHRGNGIIARCPACALTGADKSGNHLKIWPDGRFACVVNLGAAGAEHRKEIWRLVGLPDNKPGVGTEKTGMAPLFASN